MSSIPQVTLLLPVHNEEKNIAALIRRSLEILGNSAEVIVVDDGSTDRTAEEVKKTPARLVQHPVNRGKGAALRTGIEYARGPIVVVMDGDGQDDPAQIPILLKAQADQDADFVNGSRFLGELRPGAISLGNRWGTAAVDFILNRLLGIMITDSQAGFRCFKADRLRALRLQSDGYEVETETVIKARRLGYQIVEVPVRRSARAHGTSDHRKVRFALRFFRLLWRIYLARSSPCPMGIQ